MGEPMEPYGETEDLYQLRRDHLKLAEDFDSHRQKAEERWDHEDKRHEALLGAVEQNTQSVKQLTESTKDLVQLYKDVQSVGRVGGKVQKFMLWVAKWPVIGAGLYAIYAWGTDLLTKWVS